MSTCPCQAAPISEQILRMAVLSKRCHLNIEQAPGRNFHKVRLRPFFSAHRELLPQVVTTGCSPVYSLLNSEYWLPKQPPHNNLDRSCFHTDSGCGCPSIASMLRICKLRLLQEKRNTQLLVHLVWNKRGAGLLQQFARHSLIFPWQGTRRHSACSHTNKENPRLPGWRPLGCCEF